jgi:predicted DNA-binding antitoxin AbrB/MazE fold protein
VFARYCDGVFQPLDPVDLADGQLCQIAARCVQSVPALESFRRIIALGGIAGLPADFAEQHDHYAHGAPRK